MQIQPSIISQQAVAAAAAAAQQQYAAVPVSMVETGRQMLLTVSVKSIYKLKYFKKYYHRTKNQHKFQNAVQTSWPGGSRQMAAIVPSWQQLPPQHATIQQPLLSDAGDWGRPLIVDSSAILQVRLLEIDLLEYPFLSFAYLLQKIPYQTLPRDAK